LVHLPRYKDLQMEFGFTAEHVVLTAKEQISRHA
jgi:hypothetical protein